MGSDLHQPVLEKAQPDNKRSCRNSCDTAKSLFPPSPVKGRNSEVFGTDLVLCHSQTLPIPFSMTHLLKDFSIGVCRLLCVDFPWFSFHLLCTIPEGTEQSGPYFPVTHLVCLIFHGIEGKMCPSFFFYCVKLVDFLPVNGLGPPLAVQREVWHSQWEWKPFFQSN